MNNAASEKSIAKARERAAADIATDKIVITTLMSTVQGRRWVYLKLSEAQLFADDGVLEPQWMAFVKGRRAPALAILASVNQHAPAMYIRMMEENAGAKLVADETEDKDENPDG